MAEIEIVMTAYISIQYCFKEILGWLFTIVLAILLIVQPSIDLSSMKLLINFIDDKSIDGLHIISRLLLFLQVLCGAI